jgi:hypothetical protein
MKDIADLTVTQLRIYPADCVPLAELRVPTNASQIKDVFKFGGVQIDPFGSQVAFSNGLFEDGNKSFTIPTLVVDDRKITAQVRGHSRTADAFYAALTTVLGSLSGVSEFEPLLKAEDTTCIATLQMDFSELLAPALWRFIQSEAKSKLAREYGKPKSIAFKNLAFEISYEPTDSKFEEHGIALSNKLLTIEPRIGTPLSERRFFTSSPTDSETHISMLEKLEATLSVSK